MITTLAILALETPQLMGTNLTYKARIERVILYIAGL